MPQHNSCYYFDRSQLRHSTLCEFTSISLLVTGLILKTCDLVENQTMIHLLRRLYIQLQFEPVALLGGDRDGQPRMTPSTG